MGDSWICLIGQNKEKKKNYIASQLSFLPAFFTLVIQFCRLPSLLYKDTIIVLLASSQQSTTLVKLSLFLLRLISYGLTVPLSQILTFIKPCQALTAKQMLSSIYQFLLVIYLIATQFLPFFLLNFYFFLKCGFRLISDALYLLTFISYDIILLGGNETKLFYIYSFVYSLLDIFSIIAAIDYPNFRLVELFHESLMPVSVNSISQLVPFQSKSNLNRSTQPLRIILEIDTASLSYNLLHLDSAFDRCPYPTFSVTKTTLLLSLATSNILMTFYDLQSFILFKYFGSYGLLEFVRIFIVTESLVYFWIASCISQFARLYNGFYGRKEQFSRTCFIFSRFVISNFE